MIGLSIFSSIYSISVQTIREIEKRCSLNRIITDETVCGLASEISNIPASKIRHAFLPQTSVFNTFTHEKECHIAYLRKAVSLLMDTDRFLIHGYTALLLPQEMVQVIRFGINRSIEERLLIAKAAERLPETEIRKIITREDQTCAAWSQFLFNQKNPWHPEQYDTVIDGTAGTSGDTAQIVSAGFKEMENSFHQRNTDLSDFKLSADINVALASEGHNVQVKIQGGVAFLTILQHVLMMTRLQEELSSIVRSVPGTEQLDIKIQQGSEASVIYQKRGVNMPAKLLLVDDEVEFVQTLSERLQMRDIDSVIAHDGHSAIKLVHSDDPEVMVVDLKMPGMDGMGVLKEVKKIRPEIEVIVLTGHGSEQDRIECMEMGAFDYMQKPVDIKELSASLKRAYEKIQSRA